MTDDSLHSGAGGDTRRDALKKLGLGAGAAWVAPIAMSFHSAAGAAQGGSPPPSSTTTTTTTSLPPPIPGCEQATCGSFVVCSSSNSDCVCVSTPQGGFCVPGSTACSSLSVCGPGLTCPPGEVCATDTCCGPAFCIPVALIEQCPPGGATYDTIAKKGVVRTAGARVSTGAGTLGG